MGITRLDAVAVVDENPVAIGALIARGDNFSSGRREDGLAAGSGDVGAVVKVADTINWPGAATVKPIVSCARPASCIGWVRSARGAPAR